MEIDILIDQSYFLMEEPPEEEKNPNLSDILDEYLQAMKDNPGESPSQILFEILMKIKRNTGTNTPETSPETSPEILPMEINLDMGKWEEFEESENEEESESSEEQEEEENTGDQQESGNGINVTGENDLKVEEDKIVQIRRPGRISGFFN